MSDRQELSSNHVGSWDPKTFFDHVDANFRITDPLSKDDPLLEAIQFKPQEGSGLYPFPLSYPIPVEALSLADAQSEE